MKENFCPGDYEKYFYNYSLTSHAWMETDFHYFPFEFDTMFVSFFLCYSETYWSSGTPIVDLRQQQNKVL